MGQISFWYWFDVNRYTFYEDTHKTIFYCIFVLSALFILEVLHHSLVYFHKIGTFYSVTILSCVYVTDRQTDKYQKHSISAGEIYSTICVD